jgi:GNAT superfamily N-acetyltransferase
MRGSLNFAIYDDSGDQAAYARVVTDRATFAWLCDVYVAPSHRGKGLGTWLAAAVRDHLAPYRLKRVLLSTLDAHEVYAKAGFVSEAVVFPELRTAFSLVGRRVGGPVGVVACRAVAAREVVDAVGGWAVGTA